MHVVFASERIYSASGPRSAFVSYDLVSNYSASMHRTRCLFHTPRPITHSRAPCCAVFLSFFFFFFSNVLGGFARSAGITHIASPTYMRCVFFVRIVIKYIRVHGTKRDTRRERARTANEYRPRRPGEHKRAAILPFPVKDAADRYNRVQVNQSGTCG